MAVKSGEALFDTRTVERHIGSGLISDTDYKKHLESLEDCAEEAEESEVVMRFEVARRRAEEANETEAEA